MTNRFKSHYKIVAFINEFYHYNTAYSISSEERFSYLKPQKRYLDKIRNFVVKNDIENTIVGYEWDSNGTVNDFQSNIETFTGNILDYLYNLE